MIFLFCSLVFLAGLIIGLFIGSRVTEAKLEDMKFKHCIGCAELKAAATVRVEDVEEWG